MTEQDGRPQYPAPASLPPDLVTPSTSIQYPAPTSLPSPSDFGTPGDFGTPNAPAIPNTPVPQPEPVPAYTPQRAVMETTATQLVEPPVFPQRAALETVPAQAVVPVQMTGAADIATIPPLPTPEETGYPVNRRTELPRRPWPVAVASTCFWVAAVLAGASYLPLWSLATTVTGLPQAARLFGWFNPDPVSLLCILLVLATALITVLVVAACGAAAYNHWQGKNWTRWGSWVVVVICGLTYLLHPWAIVVVPVALLGAIMSLFSKRSFRAAMAPAQPPPDLVAVDPTPVIYGPQELIGN